MMVCHLSHHPLLSDNLTLSSPPCPSPSVVPLSPPTSSLPLLPSPLLPLPLLSLPTALQNIVLVWREVVEELRYRWENGHLIPKLATNCSVLCPPVLLSSPSHPPSLQLARGTPQS